MMTTNPSSFKNARIITRAEHSVSRKDIDPHALKVLYRLNSHGYAAYLVGGCVRDLLLNHHPKDFDIATNASPEQIKEVFKNCRLIGRRFRLAHVYFGSHIVEVATFRGHHITEKTDEGHAHDNGLILRDNVYGTIEEDAARRDFTINALYYNVQDFSLIDFTGGADDLEKKRLRIIGDPETRYREDPVRMLRAVRFVAKLDMKMMTKTAQPIRELGELLYQISPARLFDEVIKLFHTKHAAAVYPALCKYDLFRILFPETFRLIKSKAGKKIHRMLEIAFHETDQRLLNDKSVSCAFLFAFLLWHVTEESYLLFSQKNTPSLSMQQASQKVLRDQQKITALPRRFVNDIIEIWQLQWRFFRRQPRFVWRTLSSHRFRAAFDLLALRAKIEPQLQELVDWWEKFQKVNSHEQEKMLADIQAKKS